MALEKTISRARLARYLEFTDGDLSRALDWYERNSRLSEALYTPLQCLEVCFRNTIHFHMSAVYGADWTTSDVAPLAIQSRSMVFEALEKLQKEAAWPSNDSLVAELRFAFWVGLLGPGYDATIWRRAIYRGFFEAGSKKRSDVHSRFNAIRRLRNRVAHHEPIFHRDPLSLHAELLEAIGWMCSETCAWATHHSRFPAVFAANVGPA